MKSKATKRIEAAQRQAKYNALSPDQKLARAKIRGGTHTREYQRLLRASQNR